MNPAKRPPGSPARTAKRPFDRRRSQTITASSTTQNGRALRPVRLLFPCTAAPLDGNGGQSVPQLGQNGRGQLQVLIAQPSRDGHRQRPHSRGQRQRITVTASHSITMTSLCAPPPVSSPLGHPPGPWGTPSASRRRPTPPTAPLSRPGSPAAAAPAGPRRPPSPLGGYSPPEAAHP